MADKKLCIFNWSGGKDSTLALHYALKDPSLEIKYLVTSVSEQYNRVSMHGVREALLVKQAESIGIPLYQIRLPEMPDMKTYDDTMRNHLVKFKAEGITHSIFGDIFLEDLRKYREDRLAEVDMKGIFPLWHKDTKLLINEFLQLDYKTTVVCAQQDLEKLCGVVIDKHFMADLPSNIDPCGENGEFHTFVFDGPIFKNKIQFEYGEKVFRTYHNPANSNHQGSIQKDRKPLMGFWYIDLVC